MFQCHSDGDCALFDCCIQGRGNKVSVASPGKVYQDGNEMGCPLSSLDYPGQASDCVALEQIVSGGDMKVRWIVAAMREFIGFSRPTMSEYIFALESEFVMMVSSSH